MAETTPKIRIMKGATPDLSAATYQIFDESHTIGNALRWMIMKNPKVEFCGYRTDTFSCLYLHCLRRDRVPHPSENLIQLRIQMYDGLSSLNTLLEALDNLDAVCDSVEEKYLSSLQDGRYERWEEKS